MCRLITFLKELNISCNRNLIKYPFIIFIFQFIYIITINKTIATCYGWDFPFEQSAADQYWQDRPNYLDNTFKEITENKNPISIKGQKIKVIYEQTVYDKEADTIHLHFNAPNHAILLHHAVLLDIETIKPKTIKQLQIVIHNVCYKYVHITEMYPKNVDECNDPNHPINQLLYELNKIHHNIPRHNNLTQITAMIGGSLISLLAYDYLGDINKDIESLEFFFIITYRQ